MNIYSICILINLVYLYRLPYNTTLGEPHDPYYH